MEEHNCIACGGKAGLACLYDNTGTKEFTCPSCGHFYATDHVFRDASDYGATVRRKLARHLYETNTEDERFVATHELDNYDGRHGRLVSLESVATMYERDGSALEKYEDAIRRMASRSASFGHNFVCRDDRWLFPTMDDLEASHIRIQLAREGYLLEKGSNFCLTPKGLQYAAELGRLRKSEGTSVFVAACFSDDLAEACTVIASTVRELGYHPRQVNLVPHNNLIDLEIYRLIRESRFVVADLTYNRPSVYYEVGFAHGLGLEVVLTCHLDHINDARGTKDELRRVHFDLNHRNILTWSEPGDLAEKLRGHIYQSFGAMNPTEVPNEGTH